MNALLVFLIIGQWQFYKYNYQGNDLPPIDPTMSIFYEFSAEGDSRLYWYNEDKSIQCERRGKYVYSEGKILDQVTWVSPQNTSQCGADPDMKMGTTTSTKADVSATDLTLHLHLGDHPLLYIMKRL